MAYDPITHQPDRARWLAEAGWGVFCHYLADEASATSPANESVDAWNAHVESFDVDRLVDRLAEVGVGYFGITIGQNSGFYCSPNATYDQWVGRTPSRCSRRDLIAELARGLTRRGIRFLAYLPSGAPENDALACERLQWAKVTTDRSGEKPSLSERLAFFQACWEAVIREWSLRWGELVSGWWIDGCYYTRAMYAHPDAPNFASLMAALRAGNPNAAVALNPGVKIPVTTVAGSGEDFTAGEIDQALAVDMGRPNPTTTWPDGRLNGVQLHVLLPMGRWWGVEPRRFTPDFVRSYSHHIMNAGGAITWDVPIDHGGNIPAPYLEALAAIGRSTAARK